MTAKAQMSRAEHRHTTSLGWAVVAISFLVYYVVNRTYDAGRGDFYYLADAFLHGRTWLDVALGPWDIITIGERIYVPFAPFPAIALLPVVALVGPATADAWEPVINAALAASSVGMAWALLGRIDVPRRIDRVWLVLLLGFSTQLLWVTLRGGVWHTGQLVATILTLGCLVELWGRRRAWLIGLMVGAAFLSRAPLAFAIPIYALLLIERDRLDTWPAAKDPWIARFRRIVPWRTWLVLAIAVAPFIVGFFLYNHLRFGTPLESGYAIAKLPEFLERQRAIGLFSFAHVPMNLDLFLLHLPRLVDGPPFLLPDGLGLSVLITSPGLLYAARADLNDERVRLLLLATVFVLIPTLLYYGGGWLQFGYRYFLDSVPFVIAMCGLAAARDRRIGLAWKVLIAVGVLVMTLSIPFAYAT